MINFFIFELLLVLVITIIHTKIKIDHKVKEIKEWHSTPDAGFQGEWSFFDWIKYVLSE